jgi:ribonuclease R
VQITNLEELAKKTAWEYEDRVFARWADKHVGEVFKAVVVDLHPTKPPIAKLHDDIEGARIFLEESDGVELFEKVEIEILGVNLATAKIYAKVTQRSTEDV